MKPFTIAVDDDALADLDRRLRDTRWADDGPGGLDRTYLRDLIDYWRGGFDWRAQEKRLNALPQFVTEIDGLDIHFLYRRGRKNAFPLLLTHGWPGTGFDMERLLPLLSDDFDVVVPSLPGYGFSQRPDRPGFGPERVAGMWAELMTRLGYRRFGAFGTDWGAAVSMWLAKRFPERLSGLHVTFIPGFYRPPLEHPLSAEEKRFLETMTEWFDAEGGYHRLQSTKPQTPAYALTDSPVGLAAWIVEKMIGWSDGDVFSRDDLLTNVSIYWFTATIGSSMRFYRENRLRPNHFAPGERVRPPLGMAAFPAEPVPPRSWVERVFDVTRWTAMPRGGHFGPIEAPEPLADEIRGFFQDDLRS